MKFGYLIMAHDNPKQLEILLELLDDPQNDIYLHIDKKNSDINIECLKQRVTRASLHIYKQYRVYWADISQTKCQFFLLEKATREYHDYYHLISGHDLPLKTNAYIQDFFKRNTGKQFIHFESKDYIEKRNCIYYHYFFSMMNRSKSERIKRILNYFEDISIMIQKKFNIHRNFYCGANWFSVTDSFARDLLKEKKRLIKMISFTICTDEYVLQNYIKKFANKKYSLYCEKEDDYNSIMRKIDWKRGNPYVWKIKDAEELLNSKMLFARKFDIKIDADIIYCIKENIEKQNVD